jgi:hypothetical protein
MPWPPSFGTVSRTTALSVMFTQTSYLIARKKNVPSRRRKSPACRDAITRAQSFAMTPKTQIDEAPSQ